MSITDTLTKFTRVDLSKLDLRQVELPAFELPKFDMPKFELPELPKVELPKVDLPVDAERVAGWARDAAYVGVGAAVVVGQEAEQRVRDFATTVSGALGDALSTAGDTVTARVRAVVDAVR